MFSECRVKFCLFQEKKEKKQKPLNSTGSLSDAILERKNPFALLSRGPGVLRVPRRQPLSERPAFGVGRGTTGPRQSCMVYCVGYIGLPLASPFTDALSGVCKQDSIRASQNMKQPCLVGVSLRPFFLGFFRDTEKGWTCLLQSLLRR